MCAPVLCLTPDYSVRSYPAVSLPHRLPQALPFQSFISECFPASLYLNYLLLFILFFFFCQHLTLFMDYTSLVLPSGFFEIRQVLVGALVSYRF